MCIAFPGRILSIDENNFAVIEISGTPREVCWLKSWGGGGGGGDYVISHQLRPYRLQEAAQESLPAPGTMAMEYDVH
jgi:hydrogenase maturation factor